MQIVSYRSARGWRAGALRDGRLIDIAGAERMTVRDLLRGGPTALEAAAKRARENPPLDEVVAIGPPITDPEKIICFGLNYKRHAAEVGMAIPPAPTFFPKYRNSLIANGESIVLPTAVTSQVDYEVELAIVIGKQCRNVTEKDALSYVAGYSALNDISARDLQMQTSQWGAGKAIDTFAPFGPVLVTADEIPDPQQLAVITRLNGETMQDSNTSDMAFTCAQLIAFLSGFMTLEPGDVLATGTPEGVGMGRKPPVWLKDGDVIEIEIEKIGVLRNPIVNAVPALV